MNQHFLVVGQGLAGSLLAQYLIEREQAVTIADNRVPHSASRVAAGIMNPITGQRLVLAPDVMRCLPFAIKHYEKLSNLFDQQFYFPKTLLRLFLDRSDKDRYQNRLLDNSYKDFLGEEFEKGDSGEPVNDSLGGFRQEQTGYLDINALLDCLRAYLAEHANLIEGNFDYAELEMIDDAVSWKGKRFDHVVFCEGAAAVDNPWFRWLPFQLSKGELIEIQSDESLPKSIINRKHWLLPQSDKSAKVGASYIWKWNDALPSVEQKEKLRDSIRKMLAPSIQFTVTKQLAGIRPTTKDKQPFIGTHPLQKQLHCFNGFGSRGAMLIPFYAAHMVEYLLSKSDLIREVDICRYQHASSMVVLARRYLSENIHTGDIVIDATVGNGHDTELMARCVGDQGRVIGFDIQQQAIDFTEQRLKQTNLLHRVTLIHDNHAHMKRQLSDDIKKKVSLIAFNLGFLPGSDKSCVTKAETTLVALDEALSIINSGGSIAVMAYPGHECGKKETEAVKQWIMELNKTVFDYQTMQDQQNFDAPCLYIITKIKNSS